MIHAKKWHQFVFGQLFFDPHFCYPHFFLPNFFWLQFFLGQNIFGSKFFFIHQNFDQIFCDFGLGIWDLGFGIHNSGFRIWGLGSVTWNSGFGIEDLGLKIWDLDSSWPTDPFDRFGVAQLSKIFSMIFKRFFDFLRSAFGHGRLGQPQSLEYICKIQN